MIPMINPAAIGNFKAMAISTQGGRALRKMTIDAGNGRLRVGKGPLGFATLVRAGGGLNLRLRLLSPIEVSRFLGLMAGRIQPSHSGIINRSDGEIKTSHDKESLGTNGVRDKLVQHPAATGCYETPSRSRQTQTRGISHHLARMWW